MSVAFGAGCGHGGFGDIEASAHGDGKSSPGERLGARGEEKGVSVDVDGDLKKKNLP